MIENDEKQDIILDSFPPGEVPALAKTEYASELLSDQVLIPLGTHRAQEHPESGSIRVPFPQPYARREGLEQGTEIATYFLAPLKGIISVRKDQTNQDEIL